VSNTQPELPSRVRNSKVPQTSDSTVTMDVSIMSAAYYQWSVAALFALGTRMMNPVPNPSSTAATSKRTGVKLDVGFPTA